MLCRYHCSPCATIADAMEAYKNAFNPPLRQSALLQPGPYAATPLPDYLEALKAAEGTTIDDIQDVCYHLLQLYCNKTHPLHRLLSPTSATANHLDYSLR